MSTSTTAAPQAVKEGWVWDFAEGIYRHPLTGSRIDPRTLSPEERERFPLQPRDCGSEKGVVGEEQTQSAFSSSSSGSSLDEKKSLLHDSNDIWDQVWMGATAEAAQDSYDENFYVISTANDDQIAEYLQAFGVLPPASLYAPEVKHEADTIKPVNRLDDIMGNQHSTSANCTSGSNNGKGKERAINDDDDDLYTIPRDVISSSSSSTPRYGNGENSDWWASVLSSNMNIRSNNGGDGSSSSSSSSTSTATPSPSLPIPHSCPSGPSTHQPPPEHYIDDDASFALALSLAEESPTYPGSPILRSTSRQQREADDLAFALQLQLSLNDEEASSSQLAAQEEYARKLQEQMESDAAAAKARQEQEDRDFAERLALEFENEAMREQEEEEEERRKREEREECSICLEDKEKEEMVLLRCMHYLCFSRDCLHASVENAIKSRKPYRCCHLPVPPDVLCPHLPENLRDPYRSIYVESRTSNPLYCPDPSCSTFIEPTSIAGGVGTCGACGTRTCRHCKKEAHKGVCREDTEGNVVRDLGRRNGWKQCPSCGELVEKNQGCDHMTCKCSTEFCYRCGKLYSECPGRC